MSSSESLFLRSNKSCSTSQSNVNKRLMPLIKRNICSYPMKWINRRRDIICNYLSFRHQEVAVKRKRQHQLKRCWRCRVEILVKFGADIRVIKLAQRAHWRQHVAAEGRHGAPLCVGICNLTEPRAAKSLFCDHCRAFRMILVSESASTLCNLLRCLSFSVRNLLWRRQQGTSGCH